MRTKKAYVLDDGIGYIQLVDSMPGDRGKGDERVVEAARASIAGEEVKAISNDERLIKYLLTHGHTSPLEHVKFTMECRMPIFVARQVMRHRCASYNEESGRYGVMRDDIYIPSEARLAKGGQHTSNKQCSGSPLAASVTAGIQAKLVSTTQDAYKAYKALLGAGLARELARGVLPLNMYTQFFWTTDVHNAIQFCRKRIPKDAQFEVRRYAWVIASYIEQLSPLVYKHSGLEEL